MSDEKKYDLIIVGSGPAGLSASIYASRRKLKTLVISLTIGGQMALTNEIENYPGFDFTDGITLANKMKEQTKKWGTEFELSEVSSITKKGDNFLVKTAKNSYEVKAVILSFGLTPRKIGVPGEQEFTGKGVSYCATCDGPLFKGKTIAIIGGGNSALESAEYMSKISEKVYLIHRSDEFRAAPYLLDRIKKLDNIEFYCNTELSEIKGEGMVKAIDIVSLDDKTNKEEIKLDGVFVEIGHESKSDWLKGLVDLNKRGEVISDCNGQTSVPGLFTAGDCSDSRYKQIVIAAGAGAKSALQVYKYVAAKGGGAITSDWGKCELVGTDDTVKIKLEK